MRAEKKLSRTLDDEALRDLAREERRVKTRSKEGLSAAQAEDFKLKKRITEAAREQFTDAEWVKLDNAALIFPSTTRADKNNLFRVSVLLKEKVEPLILQKALNFLVPRFPAVTSAVKRGFFWYYLEPSTHPLTVEKDVDFPVQKNSARFPSFQHTRFVLRKQDFRRFFPRCDGRQRRVDFCQFFACVLFKAQIRR